VPPQSKNRQFFGLKRRLMIMTSRLEEQSLVNPATTITAQFQRLPLVVLIITYGIALFGKQLTVLALPWFVLQAGGSGAETGLTVFVTTLPMVLAAFFGGTLLDRLGFKRISVVSDLAGGLCFALVPLLYGSVGLDLWQLLLIVFIGGLLSAPAGIARQALLPEVANLAGINLGTANSIYSTISGINLFVSPIAATALIVFIDPLNVLWVNVVTFAIAAFNIALFIPGNLKLNPVKQAYFTGLRQSLHFIWQNRLIRIIVVQATLLTMLATPLYSVVMPLYFQKTYNDPLYLGWFLGLLGGGAVIGAVIYGMFGQKLSQRFLLIVTIVGQSLAFLLIAFLVPFPFLLLGSFIFGLTTGLIEPLINTLILTLVKVELRGRILGIITALSLGATPFGAILIGVLVETVGVQFALIPLVVGFSVFFSKTLHNLPKIY
jgi:MFS family permease